MIRPCLAPACPEPATYRGRCVIHSKEENRAQHPPANRIYSTKRWATLRRAVLNRDGHTCTGCGAFNATNVDHVQPIGEDGAPWDMANCQTLCGPCHSAKTMAEVKARGVARGDGAAPGTTPLPPHPANITAKR